MSAALVDSRAALGWDEVRDLVRRAAGALHAALGDGDRRVAVLAANANETALAYLAGLHAGVSSVPVNFHLTPGESAWILRDAGARILFVGPETVEPGLVAARLADVEVVVGWRCEPQPGLTRWEDWLAQGHGPAPSGLAPQPYLHYTSGTTGTPKATLSPPSIFPRVSTVEELLDGVSSFSVQ